MSHNTSKEEARLRLMEQGDPTWDLSENDRRAIAWVLDAAQSAERELEASREEMKGLREELEKMISPCTNACQVFDGWHQDGTAWSEWDESVRKELSGVLRKMYELSGAK